MASRRVKKDKFFKIGHRGACGYEPENTLRSFKKALALGVDMIELDVHRCASGEAVVIHDKNLERTTDGVGDVTKKSFDEIRALDAGYGEKIPRLEEILDLVNKKALVNIELKSAGSVKPVARLLDRYIKEYGWSRGDFLVSSFNRGNLSAFYRLSPSIKLGVLGEKMDKALFAFAKTINAFSLHLPKRYAKKRYIDAAHKNNTRIFIYTVDDKNDIKKMKALGVDGIFSNYPDRLL